MSATTRDPNDAVPPDQCIHCNRRTTKPWIPHLIPGATLWCDGEDPAKWVNGGPVAEDDQREAPEGGNR